MAEKKVPASDWQPNQYLKFEKERTQPTIDLVSRIELENPSRIIDIGCGPGNSTAILQKRWPKAAVTGLDNSAPMLEKAQQEQPELQWIHQDVSQDMSRLGTFDIVFSNAALQWMPDHPLLLVRLFSMVAPGGVLALQLPDPTDEPFYGQLRRLIESPKWANAFNAVSSQPVYHPYSRFYNILCTLPCALTLWQTSYIYAMQSHLGIVEWYKGSGLRPYLDALPDEKIRQEFLDEYLIALQSSYPKQEDGTVLFVMPRIFLLAVKA